MLNIFGKHNALRQKNLNKDISKFELIALLAMMLALNALAIDIMLPALPQIAQDLGAQNANDQQLVISAYMIGVGIAQLFFGPISDRFGRRPPLMAGFIIYIIASIAAMIAPNFITLLLLRFVQGLGTAVFRVVALAIMRDKFAGRAMAEVVSLVYMVFMVVPIIAPSVGQLILFNGIWELIFLFVALFGIIVGLWAFYRLPETLDPNNIRPLTFASIFGGFKIVVSHRFSFSYALAGMCFFGALLGMIMSSQQIFVDVYNLGNLFPIAFAGIGIFMAIASFINSRIVKHLGMRKIAHFAIFTYIAASLTLSILSLFGHVPFIVFYILLITCFFMFSWASANMNSLSMQPLGKLAGTAASIFGFVQTLGATIIGLIIGRFFNGTITPIAFGFAFMGLVALALVLFAESGKLFGESEE